MPKLSLTAAVALMVALSASSAPAEGRVASILDIAGGVLAWKGAFGDALEGRVPSDAGARTLELLRTLPQRDTALIGAQLDRARWLKATLAEAVQVVDAAWSRAVKLGLDFGSYDETVEAVERLDAAIARSEGAGSEAA